MLLPPVLDKYALQVKIGEGPFGMVYAAWDQVLEAERRLKIMHPELAQDGALVDRWRRLLARTGKLVHPVLARPLDVNEDQGFYFTVLPVWPQDLRQALVLHGPWEPRRAVALVRTLAEVLVLAHAQGLFHGDLKPSNVLLDGHGHPVLTDLGWMQAAVETYGARLAEQVPRLTVTPYVPPEVWEGRGLTPAGDVYALAQLLHELLTGRTFDPVQGDFAALDAWQELAPALRAGLSLDPAQRPPSVTEWLTLLAPTMPQTRSDDAPQAEVWETDMAAPPGSEVWEPQPQAVEAPRPDAQPQAVTGFPTAPSLAEAAAPVARDATWNQAASAPPASSGSDRRALLIGCGLFMLVALLLACTLAGMGYFAWQTYRQFREEAPWTDVRPEGTSAASEIEAGPATAEVEAGPIVGDDATGAIDPRVARQAELWQQQALRRAPDLSDDFSDPTRHALTHEEDADTFMGYQDGVYVIHVYPEGYIAGAFFNDIYDAAVMRMKVRLAYPEQADDGSFGFVCAAQDEDHYYTFDVSEDGYAAIWRVSARGLDPIVVWEPLPAAVYDRLLQGTWVSLTAVCSPDALALWAGDQLLVAGRDPDPLGPGKIGLFVNTLEYDDLRVEFDDFQIWEITP